MSHRLGEKALACLRMAAMSTADARRTTLYLEACNRWSQKAVDTMFQSLADRGYIYCGVTARSGWLIDKGVAALAEADAANGEVK